VNEIAFLLIWPALIVVCAIRASAAHRRFYWTLAGLLAFAPAAAGMLISQQLPTGAQIVTWVLVIVLPIGTAFFVARNEIMDGRIRATIATAVCYYLVLLLGFSMGVESGALVP
jgi:hypothetical protein